MKKWASLLLIPIVLFELQACKKNATIIPAPSACMTLNSTTIHVHNAVIVHNCSVADQVSVAFTDSTQPDLRTCRCTFVSYPFDNTQTYQYAFNNTGPHYVHVIARNNANGSPVEYETMLVNVIP